MDSAGRTTVPTLKVAGPNPKTIVPAISLIAATLAFATGCSTHVSPPSNLTKVQIVNKNTHSAETTIPMSTDGFMVGDMDAETTVSDECLAAWRRAIKGDTDGALKQLDALNSKFPRMPTISMMQGQVCELAGRKEEAITYYRDAVKGNEFSSLHQFKLAEALKAAGKSKEAAEGYRKVLKSAPNFVHAKLGLARVLFEADKTSAEAVQIVEDLLSAQPDNQEAKKLQAELKAGK